MKLFSFFFDNPQRNLSLRFIKKQLFCIFSGQPFFWSNAVAHRKTTTKVQLVFKSSAGEFLENSKKCKKNRTNYQNFDLFFIKISARPIYQKNCPIVSLIKETLFQNTKHTQKFKFWIFFKSKHFSTTRLTLRPGCLCSRDSPISSFDWSFWRRFGKATKKDKISKF